MEINDRINLLSNLYQSGANVSQLLSDLHLLSNVLDGKSTTKESSPQELASGTSVNECGWDTVTQSVIDKWISIIQSTNEETQVNLYEFQGQFLSKTFYMPNVIRPTLRPGNYYLGAKGIGLTTAMVLHCARTLISTPNIEILYISPSNEKNEDFIKAVSLVMDTNLIQNKSAANIKMANGSKLSSTSYQAYTTLIESSQEGFQQPSTAVDRFVQQQGVPNILLLDDSENAPFKHVNNLLNIGSKCEQFIISGHAKTAKGMMYEVFTNHKRIMNRNILPWWEGDLTNMDMVKTSFTTDQFNSLFCCQFIKVDPNTVITTNSSPSKAYECQEIRVKIYSCEPIKKLAGIHVIDGELLSDHDLVLVNGQDNPANNGVYVVAANAKWHRYEKCSAADDIIKTTIKITHGEKYSNTDWISNWTPNDIYKLDIDRIQYVQLINGTN